jgi:uncharacterized protein (DUF924 family)
MEGAREVVAFWREAGSEKWFKKNPDFDAEIRRRFLPLVEQAAEGKLDGWVGDAEGALALMILTDQFPRNLFRGEARAFAADPRARRLALEALHKGHPAAVSKDLSIFFYLPFEHSESLADQDRSVALFRGYGNENYLKYADIHRDVIVRFGRFPHRNKALGRMTTPAEQAFLDSGGFSA